MIVTVPTPTGYRLTDLPRERGDEMIDVTQWGFVFAVRPNERHHVLSHFPFERGRAVGIADAQLGPVGSAVAVHSSFPFQMRVPGGGTIPTAGLTWVAVHQGHRRRGLLTAMIDDHFARSRARGEAVSALYAAEPEIYQRFGYGRASHDLRVKLERGVALREVPGSEDLTVTLDTSSLAKHGPIVRAFQASYARPGTMTVIPDELLANILDDPESDREGAEARRFAAVRDGDQVVAWATFRRKGTWEDFRPDGIASVDAWGAATPAASRRLWSVLTDLDLMVATKAWAIAVDDPLVHLLVNERAANPLVTDNVWVRILDVKAALEGRGYEADADVVLSITDLQVQENAGLWRVRIDGGVATVEQAPGATADLTVCIQELGAAYLGGVRIEALVAAGLVTEHSPDAALALGRAMASPIAPVCGFMF